MALLVLDDSLLRFALSKIILIKQNEGIFHPGYVPPPNNLFMNDNSSMCRCETCRLLFSYEEIIKQNEKTVA